MDVRVHIVAVSPCKERRYFEGCTFAGCGPQSFLGDAVDLVTVYSSGGMTSQPLALALLDEARRSPAAARRSWLAAKLSAEQGAGVLNGPALQTLRRLALSGDEKEDPASHGALLADNLPPIVPRWAYVAAAAFERAVWGD